MDTKNLSYRFTGVCRHCGTRNMLNVIDACSDCQKSFNDIMDKSGLDIKIRIPGGTYNIHAKSYKEAIDKAIEMHKQEIDDLVKDGSIYSIKEVFCPSPIRDLKNLEVEDD